MSSSRARGSHAQGSLRTLDEFDLTIFERRTVCAILLPESLSADHSAGLAENNAKIAHIAPYKALPSPSNSCSEDEKSIPRTASGPKTSRKNAQRKTERDESQRVIVLEQSRDDEKFKFGSSSGVKELRASNDVVLKHPNLESQDCCYINLLHLEIYPDPDHDAMVLYNRSTSEFTAHPILDSQANKIKPGHQATLERGTWRLTLGNGLSFQIKVLPRPHEKLCYGCLRLFPQRAALCVKSSKGSAAAMSTKATAKVKTRAATTSKTDISKEKRYKARCIEERAKIESTLKAGPRSDSQNEPTPAPPINIAKTPFTQVFKGKRNGTAVAVKVCRKPHLKQSADIWRNELNMLTGLDHSSVVRLLDHDALILSLELEYVGPDLAQYVDEHQLSQLSEDKQYGTWMDVAKGLEYIHAQRIVHRDIKPQNILLGGGGRGAAICDFGISAKIYQEPETFNGETPCYIPPEYLFNSPRGFEGDI